MVTRNITSIPTTYRGIRMRSRLEARWAAFFDLIKVRWEYEPVDFKGWIPDFYLELPDCRRPDENDQGYHGCAAISKLYVEVKPIRDVSEFDDSKFSNLEGWYDNHEPAIAVFGINPSVTQWTSISCGGGSFGETKLEYYCGLRRTLNADNLYDPFVNFWSEAGNIVQWKRPS